MVYGYGVGTNRWLKYTIEQIPMAPSNDRLEKLAIQISEQYDDELNRNIDSVVCNLYHLDDAEISYITG